MDTTSDYRVFNQYGNPEFGSDLDMVQAELMTEARDLFAKMLENGLTVIEVRAASEILAGTIGVMASEQILKFQAETKRMERIKKRYTNTD